jgi:hypothetical protein
MGSMPYFHLKNIVFLLGILGIFATTPHLLVYNSE